MRRHVTLATLTSLTLTLAACATAPVPRAQTSADQTSSGQTTPEAPTPEESSPEETTSEGEPVSETPNEVTRWRCGTVAPSRSSGDSEAAPNAAPAVDPARATSEQVEQVLDLFIAQSQQGINLGFESGMLRTSCPTGVNCDADFTYFAVAEENHGVYISFDGDVLRDMTLAGLRREIGYMNFRQRIDAIPGWTLVFSELQPIPGENITIESFENGRITLVGTTGRAKIFAQNTDETQCPNYEDRAMPDGCMAYRTIDVPITVRVSMGMPTHGLDCTNPAMLELGVCG